MIRAVSINIIKFIALVLIQVLILNNINIGGFVHPMLYILFIITLPFNTPKWLLLILGFFIGLIIDIFSDTLGIHAASTTLLAFVVPIIWRVLAPHDGYEIGHHPQINLQGLAWFLRYVIVATLIHHIAFFFIEAFSMEFFFSTLWSSIINTLFTVILIFLSQLLVIKKQA
jgi:rod shape-determining protein MreD